MTTSNRHLYVDSKEICPQGWPVVRTCTFLLTGGALILFMLGVIVGVLISYVKN